MMFSCDYIDYLADSNNQPIWVLLNSIIAKNGLIPEIVINNYAYQFNSETLKLHDKTGRLICEVFIPQSLLNEIAQGKTKTSNALPDPLLRINDTKEIFILKQIYI